MHSLVSKDILVCESCIEGKMTERPFTSEAVRTKEWLKLVHIDVCESFNVHACGGYIYVITFTNDDSRYGYVYLMHKKFDALDKVKEFKAKSEKQLHKTWL